MTYFVKELVYTLQGEGACAGRAAVFCRFTGCNLWSGLEVDRSQAVCQFCDTDFVGIDGPGGGRFESATQLADAIATLWPGSHPPLQADGWRRAASRLETAVGVPLVVCTGGEPALQLDASLIDALHARGFAVAIETNGTIDLAPGIDWVCVSPKAHTELRVRSGDELKLIYPQPGAEPELYAHLAFHHFFVQPMDGPDRDTNARQAVAWCLAHPHWRVSVQTHKILGIP